MLTESGSTGSDQSLVLRQILFRSRRDRDRTDMERLLLQGARVQTVRQACSFGILGAVRFLVAVVHVAYDPAGVEGRVV